MAACPNTKRAYFQFRRGNAAYWIANGGTVLREGEPAYNTTTNQLKIGYKSAGGADQTWDQLPYVNAAAGAAPGGLAPGDSVLTAAIPTGTVLSGTSVIINPLTDVTLTAGQLIRFTNITSAFTTSSAPVANNTVYYIKTIISATEFTISTTSSLGDQVVFNRTFSVSSLAIGGSGVIINPVSGITPVENDTITFTNIASFTSSAVNGTIYYIHAVASSTSIEIKTALAGSVALIFAAP